MRLLRGVRSRLDHFWRLYVLRDQFYRTVTKWFADDGDATLRLDYPLDASSVVFDVGGYRGDFADAIFKRFGCRVFIFEPVPEYHAHCLKRFSGNPAITCLNYGLAASTGSFLMKISEDASSFTRDIEAGRTLRASVRGAIEAVDALGVETIDLIKINIEGGEFELLPAMIDSGLVRRTKYIQIQFHNFVAGAVKARNDIRSKLGATHREMWCYPFVWESWERMNS